MIPQLNSTKNRKIYKLNNTSIYKSFDKMEKIEVTDIEHKKCKEFMQDKECELCKKLFDDFINKKGFYNLVKSPPQLISEEDIKKYGYKKALELARKDFIRTAEGFARCKVLCRKHQALVREDNNERNERGMDIPRDFSLLRIKKSLV
jgi:hypothetical protein